MEIHQTNVGERRLKILDVACGSGKFPSALVQYAKLADANLLPINYALLDPSSFSISKVLKFPFTASSEFETTLQEFSCEKDAYDIIWATHALYAVPKCELKDALKRFVSGMAGSGFIAHACEKSHYTKHYLNGFKGGSGEPFSSAEQILQALKKI